MTTRESRSEEVAGHLLEEIVEARYPSGTRLPTEAELCDRLMVSRATLREAMKSLQQRGVVRIEQGRGSFVNPRSRWSPLDPALLAARSAGPGEDAEAWSEKLLEARQLVEVGVAELAARRRTDDDLATMGAALTAMREAHRADDVPAFTRADLQFHRAVARSVHNELIAALFDPLGSLVEQERLRTSRSLARRRAAIVEHAAVLQAIVDRAPAAARAAMSRHIRATVPARGRRRRPVERTRPGKRALGAARRHRPVP